MALVVGSDAYNDPWPRLSGAVADARNIETGIRKAGYSTRFLADPSFAEFRTALAQVLNDATVGCKTQRTNHPKIGGDRGLAIFEEITPCDNVLVFVYVSGHAFSRDGNTYLAMRDSGTPVDPYMKSFLSVEEMRGKIAERVAAQIVIADVSRRILGDPRR